jgi:NAD(P)-dependent dehydrogenase (short-subunit alcohol dehydrogenase family)
MRKAAVVATVDNVVGAACARALAEHGYHVYAIGSAQDPEVGPTPDRMPLRLWSGGRLGERLGFSHCGSHAAD